MNVEEAFIKSNEIDRAIEIVEERLKGNLSGILSCSQIGVPDSYNTILAKDDKRKVALSAPQNGWITIIESKEVNDYAMLLHMSKELQTEVLAVIQYDIAGAWGYVEISQGVVLNSYFSEDDDDIEDLLASKLEEKSIFVEPLYMFREVVREKEKPWNIVQIPKKGFPNK